jgi:predicted ArsR family transcriptional regulator
VDIATQGEDLAAIGLLQEPVRRRLYEWVIDQQQPVGRDAAASAVGIKRSLAAFHLDRLTEAGLLKASYRRLSGRSGPGAGRPARVYERCARTVEVSLPNRRYERAADLFASAIEQMGGDGPPAALCRAAGQLGESMAAGATDSEGGDLAGQARLLSALRDGGYQPTVAADGAIRLRNCPFDALVDEHRPLVCGTNLSLAQGLVRGAGATSYLPVLDQQPGYCCVAFVVDKAKSVAGGEAG